MVANIDFASSASENGPKYQEKSIQKKNTCPLCRQTFLAIKSNGRAYKVDPPKPIVRPTQNQNSPRVQIIQRRIVFVPILYNMQMDMSNWLPNYSFPNISAFNSPVTNGPINQNETAGFSWMQPSFYLPFSNQ